MKKDLKHEVEKNHEQFKYLRVRIAVPNLTLKVRVVSKKIIEPG